MQRRPLVRIAWLVFAVLPCQALADPVRLARSEVETMVVGKPVKFVRASDQTEVTWETRSDGQIYYSPPRTQRHITISGTYTIDEDGALCTKWNADKYVTMTDACYLFVRDGDKLRMVGKRNNERVIGEVVSQ